jgi:hypothetical protein
MFSAFKRFLRERQGLKEFNAVPRRERKIVFYSEGGGYWSYFEPVFQALWRDFGQPVLYVTSDDKDSTLHSPPEGLRPFNVGEGTIRTLFFAGLDADVVLMTMPDLQTFYIKRSLHPVNYVYLHHSLVSTHMVYRPEAFDHFDAILCAGPHHEAETRTREALKGLRAKELVKHGYGRLDAILAEGVRGPRLRKPDDQVHVLVAPTWGDIALLESHGKEVVGKLLNAGLQVTVRPHPRTRKLSPKVLVEILALFGGHPSFSIDEDANARRSLHAADVMVSDWSGAALEFALGLERPVIFIDIPRKVQNPTYAELDIEPLESQIRSEIGVVLSPSDLHLIGQLAQDMTTSAKDWQAAAQSVRSRWVFNHGQSGSAAATYLHSLVSTGLPTVQ